jgi:hypothetical protein
MRGSARSLAAAIVAALCFLAPPASRAATITIVNGDGPGEGFNDPTPVAPVGGNSGTTRGEQRLNVFNHAASIWGGILPSTVTIQVVATFDSQFCSGGSAVLGSAGPETVHSDFPGAELPNTWYTQALANKMSGVDQDVLEDIAAAFNSDVDNATCLGNVDWYYGLDSNEGNDIELLPVVLHELGHGLGFLTLASLGSGQLLGGVPDIYTRFMFDKSLGLSWADMTDAERLLSRNNNGNLVWNGYATTFQAPYVLDLRTETVVPPPAFVPGTFFTPEALFGPALTTTGVTAMAVEVFDGSGAPDACEPILNGGALSGKIAFIDAGGCSFTSKVAAAQAAGAIGAIVVNNVGGAPYRMPGSNPSITIPSVMISQDEGNVLREDVNAELVTATLRRNPTVRAGTHPDGQVLLYAPSAVEPGSSLSHFDVTASPDLVMEPFINDGLGASVDLTRHVFEDMGWLPRLTAAPVTEAPTPQRPRVRSAPNPFRPATVLTVELPRAGRTRVEIFDLQGRLVKRLHEGWLPAGRHGVAWDGADAGGRRASAGVYFARIESNGWRASQRLVKLEP